MAFYVLMYMAIKIIANPMHLYLGLILSMRVFDSFQQCTSITLAYFCGGFVGGSVTTIHGPPWLII